MNWIELLLLAAILLGLVAGGILVARSPTFWIGFGVALFKAVLPLLAKRMTKEEEAAFQKCVRQGREWDFARKRCK